MFMATRGCNPLCVMLEGALATEASHHIFERLFTPFRVTASTATKLIPHKFISMEGAVAVVSTSIIKSSFPKIILK